MNELNRIHASRSGAPRRPLRGALFGALLLACTAAGAAEEGAIAVPAFDDKYSAFVRQLESGQTDINYREFRESFLESTQFEVAATHLDELAKLRASLPPLMKQMKTAEIIQVTRKILSIDYTDMAAHKILQQSYKIVGDEPNRKKYHDIEFGLLNSIVRNGDGKTCATAWPVVQIQEEYFILGILGARVTSQSVYREGGLCDRMEVITEQGNAVYYFGVVKIFERYDKSLNPKTR